MDSVFFKTLSKSIYTSNMIKGGGQGGLKGSSMCRKWVGYIKKIFLLFSS